MATHVAGEPDMPMPKKSSGKKSLSHIVVKRAENGGHSITHHFDNYQHEPEVHVFSKDEGPEAHDHIEKCTGMCQE